MLRNYVRRILGKKNIDDHAGVPKAIEYGHQVSEMALKKTGRRLDNLKEKNPLDLFEVNDDIKLISNKVPLIWWPKNVNFGDLLSPWLVSKLTKRKVLFGGKVEDSYTAIGSIMKYSNQFSTIWGTGMFGMERKEQIHSTANYLCVRGPLTRSKILDYGGECHRVYGDPALLVPFVYWPKTKKKYKYGLIIRWSENKWRNLTLPGNCKLIDFGTYNIEDTIDDILSCEFIISSSLHGLILADAYRIPSAWLIAEKNTGGSRPGGGEFKYYDYFASVNKFQKPQMLTVVNNTPLLDGLKFYEKEIEYDYFQLLDSCPFIKRKKSFPGKL